MKKLLLPFLLLITFCSSGAENTEPQNTSNNEESQELAQNEESQELAQNEESQELAQNEEFVFVVDSGYDIYELFSCLESKGLSGLPEPEINTSEILVRFDGYQEDNIESLLAMVRECEEERDKDNNTEDNNTEDNNTEDNVLEVKVYSWDQPENIDWIEYNFNTTDTFCDDVDGYCAGWQENASQECRDNYKLGSVEEDVKKRLTYEGCIYQMVFKPYISLVIDRTTTPLTQDQKRNGDRLKNIGWNKPTDQVVEFRVTADIPTEIVEASKEGMLAAIDYLGSHGPLRVYIVGNDVDLAEDLALDFCEYNYPLEEKNRCLDDQGKDMLEMAYIYPGGNGFQQSSWRKDSPVQAFVHNPYADENNKHSIHPDVLLSDRKVNAHEYFHVYQGAHSIYRGESDNSFGWSTTRWVEEGAAVYFEQVLLEKMGWQSKRRLDQRTIGDLRGIKSFTTRFPGISMKDVDTGFQTERLFSYCGNLCIGALQYEFGHVAFQYLETKSSQEKILFDYWEEYTELGWADAFEKVFEMSVSDFYIEFEEFLNLSVDEQMNILNIEK
jgi:hypothetical protein